MIRSNTFALLTLAFLALPACGSSVEGGGEGGGEQTSFTKDEARAMQGVTKDGADVCALEGWYDDGVCDDFCVTGDADCGVDGGEPCSEEAGMPCAEGFFCDFPIDTMCGATIDALGTCKPIPENCDQNYDPVCGCDGQTHSNACTANMAGTAAATAGECP
ncbi:Kazal-type serine protease inhibitor domain-containing protein [Polyangium sp. 6x1]|uniref:Kazal-type serine protease inhibitor domain-containing protein n=1 Tax=Polyangium sp. 6x1 TaxID=3042689 RepID=UPI002482BCE6|nr:Kazal-type serine protease inhibitor domain-containing protein [Polyangium sp. 6x1]MDI1451059.1 Kazal-type serine protease inhibitor domain-containing protein [Polyangium sp. 6x1]